MIGDKSVYLAAVVAGKLNMYEYVDELTIAAMTPSGVSRVKAAMNTRLNSKGLGAVRFLQAMEIEYKTDKKTPKISLHQ